MGVYPFLWHYVKYGVAMGNSDIELKRQVNYVTDTNDNNGVAKFLKKYFF